MVKFIVNYSLACTENITLKKTYYDGKSEVGFEETNK